MASSLSETPLRHGDDVCDSTDVSKLPKWHAPCPLGVCHEVTAKAFVFETGLCVKNSLTRTKVPFVSMTGTNQVTWYMYVRCRNIQTKRRQTGRQTATGEWMGSYTGTLDLLIECFVVG